MFINRIVCILIGVLFLHTSYSEPPFEILRSCIDLKPKDSSITLTRLVDGTVSEVNKSNCENQFDQEVNGHLYGMVTCNDEFYLIINDQKIKADTAINRSINPEIKPGWIFTNRAMWHKIDQGNHSYLCIQAAITESGIGAKDSQYYIVENAFEQNAVPVIYYYFFDKSIIPITSAHY